MGTQSDQRPGVGAGEQGEPGWGLAEEPTGLLRGQAVRAVCRAWAPEQPQGQLGLRL